MRFVLLFTLVFITTFQGFSQRDVYKKQIDELYIKWKKKDYKHVYAKGYDLRSQIVQKYNSEQPHSRYTVGIPFLDFLILSSMCFMPDTKIDGCKAKEYLFKYRLADNVLNELKSQFNKGCNGNGEIKPTEKILLQLQAIPIAHVGGNMKKSAFGYYVDGMETEKLLLEFNLPFFKDTTKLNSLFGRRVLKKSTDSLHFVRRLSSRLKSPVHIITSNFIIITDSTQVKIRLQLWEIGSELEKTLEHFTRYFQFPTTDEYITVYIAPSYFGVGALIKSIYQLKMDIEDIRVVGFSNPIDNSMFANVPSSKKVGTLKHELFHLLINRSFGNLPTWFEEGLATLCEKSDYNSGKLVGIDTLTQNWERESSSVSAFRLLYRQMHYNRMRMSRLKRKNAIQKNNSRQITSSNLAQLKTSGTFKYFQFKNQTYFLFYVHEMGKLQELYKAFKDREENLFLKNAYKTDEELILQVFGYTDIDILYEEFQRWVIHKKDLPDFFGL